MECSSGAVSLAATVEVLAVHAVSLRALEVVQVVNPQDLVVGQVLASLHAEQGLPTHMQMFVQPHQCTNVLVVGSNVI